MLARLWLLVSPCSLALTAVSISKISFHTLLTLVHPNRILSSLPNLSRNDLNEVSVENGQISLSVSRDHKESRLTGCIMLTIIDGDIREQLLSIGLVVLNVLLKLFRKSGITAQVQTKENEP